MNGTLLIIALALAVLLHLVRNAADLPPKMKVYQDGFLSQRGEYQRARSCARSHSAGYAAMGHSPGVADPLVGTALTVKQGLVS